MKYSKKTKNRRELINTELRQIELKFTAVYYRLKTFIERLQIEKIMLDYNFDGVIRGYSANKMAHLHAVATMDEPIISYDSLSGMRLYIEDEQYRTARNSTYVDSDYGWASPFWSSLCEGSRMLSFEDMITLNQIVVGIKIDYQILVDLNYTWRKKMTDQSKWELLNQKLEETEYTLCQIIRQEREMCRSLHGQQLIDIDKVKQRIELYTRNRRANESHFSTIGNPFWEHKMDWSTLFELNLQHKDWSCTSDYCRYKPSAPKCYSMGAISKNLSGAQHYVPIIDSVWLQHTVEYQIVVDVK